MNNHITFKQASACFDAMGIPWGKIELDNGYFLILTTRGGRAFGPFLDDGESLFWMNKAFLSPEEFKEYIDSGRFHIGGERLWIGPELSFFCTEPELFDETYAVQSQMDPGSYILEKSNNSATLCLEGELKILRSGSNAIKKFSLLRSYQNASDPLKYIENGKSDKVRYCGYSQRIVLTDKNPEVESYLEPWLLVQVNPDGKILVPYLGDFDFVDYYDPMDDSVIKAKNGFAELITDGKRKYKAAFRAANTFGRFGYIGKRENEYYLIVRNYYNDPSIPYCAEPWNDLGNKGCSMYFYNDDNSNGGFTELEHTCGIIGLDSETNTYSGVTSLWMYYSEEKTELEKIIKTLLGINYIIQF